MNKLRVPALVLLSLLTLSCNQVKTKVVLDYESKISEKNNDLYKQNEEPSIQPKLEEEQESWGKWTCRHGKNVAYATTVVTGTAAIGAATGGVGIPLVAAKLGLAITASTGVAAGGIVGAGCGLGMAVEEFGSEEVSSASHLAASIGQGVILGATAYPVLTYCAIGGLTESVFIGASYLAFLGGSKISKK